MKYNLLNLVLRVLLTNWCCHFGIFTVLQGWLQNLGDVLGRRRNVGDRIRRRGMTQR